MSNKEFDEVMNPERIKIVCAGCLMEVDKITPPIIGIGLCYKCILGDNEWGNLIFQDT